MIIKLARISINMMLREPEFAKKLMSPISYCSNVGVKGFVSVTVILTGSKSVNTLKISISAKMTT